MKTLKVAHIPSMRMENEQEREVFRKIIKRSPDATEWKECPCGYFFNGVRCPDKTCKAWQKLTGGKAKLKLYAHESSENYYEEGKKLGIEDDGALSIFCNWGYEIEFDGEVNLKTGEVKLLTVNGHKIQY